MYTLIMMCALTGLSKSDFNMFQEVAQIQTVVIDSYSEALQRSEKDGVSLVVVKKDHAKWKDFCKKNGYRFLSVPLDDDRFTNDTTLILIKDGVGYIGELPKESVPVFNLYSVGGSCVGGRCR